MSSLPSSQVFNGDPVADGADSSFGNALERVYGAAIAGRRVATKAST